jgi:hypothetical protein
MFASTLHASLQAHLKSARLLRDKAGLDLSFSVRLRDYQSMNAGAVCHSCGEAAHNFVEEEALACIPPPDVLCFGTYEIKKEYRDALFARFPFFCTEEVVGSFLGFNPGFPSQADWEQEQENEGQDNENEKSNGEEEYEEEVGEEKEAGQNDEDKEENDEDEEGNDEDEEGNDEDEEDEEEVAREPLPKSARKK